MGNCCPSAPSAAPDLSDVTLITAGEPPPPAGMIELPQAAPEVKADDAGGKQMRHSIGARRETFKLRAFARADRDGSGGVDADEFAQFMQGASDAGEAARLFKAMDVNGDGVVSREEWLAHYGLLGKGVRLVDEDRKYDGLNESTRRTIFNLLGFVKSRDAVLATAATVLPHEYMNQFPSFKMEKAMRQRCADGKPVRSYDELSAMSEAAMPRFKSLMRSIVASAGLDPDATAMYNGEPLPIDSQCDFTALTLAPLKSRTRCDEKVANEYDGQYDRLVDWCACRPRVLQMWDDFNSPLTHSLVSTRAFCAQRALLHCRRYQGATCARGKALARREPIRVCPRGWK